MSDFEMPIPNDRKKEHDLALGDGHWIDWTEYQGQRCGGIITHISDKTETGLCSGAFWIDNRFHEACKRTGPVWQMTGSFDVPTLSPSFRCHCGDHGFCTRWEMGEKLTGNLAIRVSAGGITDSVSRDGAVLVTPYLEIPAYA